MTNLTHIASFSLCEPPKNNSLSNFSLWTFLSTHVVKSCCSAILFFDTDQKRSISTGKRRSKPQIIVSMPSPVVLRLRSLALMLLFFVHIKNNIYPIVWLEKKSEYAPETDEKSLYVFRFFLLIYTFPVYVMKSIITFLWWSIGGKCVGIFFVVILSSSVTRSDLFGFRIKPFFVR